MDLGRKTRVVNLNSFGAYFFFLFNEGCTYVVGNDCLVYTPSPLHKSAF